MGSIRTHAWGKMAGLTLLAFCVVLLGAGLFRALRGAPTETAPKFKFDPDWPKPLPNKWKIGGITGLAVDKDDTVWALDRPNDLTDIELEAELTPPIADCCKRPPSMIHFDKEGNVIGSFDPPQGHGMAVDSKGFAYIGNVDHGIGNVRKYDEKTGKFITELPHTPEMPPGGGGGDGGALTSEHVAGHGTAGPVAGFIRPAGARPQLSPEAQAARQAAVKAFREKYPPTTPMIVGGIEEVRLDEPNHELYAADNYLGGRVMVFDLDTFAFKRGWGAYGHKLADIDTTAAAREYTPGGPFAKEFRGHLTLNISNDGLVYAADRAGNRIDVTDKQGNYKTTIPVATFTAGGSAGGVMFSPDKEQKFLYVCDINNNHV